MLPGKRYTGPILDRPSPSLLLAFAMDGSLDSRVTFTRADSGTRFDYSGVMQTETSNVARFTHDPATYYPSSTSNSISGGRKTFAVSYQYTVGTVVQATYDASNWMRGTVIAASGSSVTIRVEKSSGSGTYAAWNLIQCLGLLVEEARTNLLLNSETLSTQSVTVSATTYTLSFYGTGTVTLSGASTAGPLVGTAANERVTLTFTPSAGSLTLTVSGSVKYANLEAGSFATSWIPTTGSAASRASDSASMTGANFSSWYNQAEGTWLTVSIIEQATSSGRVISVSPDDATTSDLHSLNYESSGLMRAYQVVSNVLSFSLLPEAYSSGARNALAFAYKQGDYSASANASAVAASSSSDAPPVFGYVRIGALTGGNFSLNGTIASIAYYPKALPGYLQYQTS